MNKQITVLILFLLIACTNEPIRNDASIKFAKKQFDFRTIPLKRVRACSFEFTNPGNTPLMVLDVKTSCDCIVPEWSEKPILPEEKGSITINYYGEFPGVFHKTISVFYNGAGSPIELEIKGEVEGFEMTIDEIIDFP